MSSLTRQLYGPTPSINKFTTPVPVDKGGTGGVTPIEAVENLGGIALSKANVANGWPRLEADLTLDASLFPVESQGGVTINGPLSLLISNKGLFKITNYDSQHVYTVTATDGFVAQSGDTIYYTAPLTAGEYGFVVDDKVIPVTVSSHYVTQPSVVTPVNTQASISNLTLLNTLFVEDRAANDSFGCSVAVSSDGSRLAVGAYNKTVNSIAGVGQVYIFTRSAGDWVLESTVTANDPVANDYFGRSVALTGDGTRLVVGAPLKDVSPLTNSGKVYVYIRSGQQWVLESTVIPSDRATSDSFGTTVAISEDGTRLAIGALTKTVSAISGCGQVYTYTRVGSVWSLETTISASDKATNDNFGISVSFNSDASILAIGAHAKDVSSVTDAGQVYIYTRSGSVWTIQTTITADDKVASDWFGYGVALSNDGSRLAISSPQYSVGNLGEYGKVYIYINTYEGWVLENIFNSNSQTPNEYYGTALCFYRDNQELIVGSHNGDSNDILNCGSVSTYRVDYDTVSVVRQPSIVDFTSSPFALSGQYLESTLTASDRAAGDNFSASIAITADGSRMAVGAHAKDVAGLTDAGQVYIYVKSGSEWVEEAILSASDRAANDWFGVSVALSIDGTRLVVGASTKDVAGLTNCGQVYIYTRTGSTWIEESVLAASDRVAYDNFGVSVALSSDASRLAVGAYSKTVSGITVAGQVYIYTRSGIAWIQETVITASDKAANDGFGRSVALTADGSRLVVGAFAKDVSGVTGAGKVYIYTRSGSVWTEESTLSASDKATDDYFGTAVTITADGSRLAVGSQNKDVSGVVDAGQVYIYTRSGSVWTLESTIVASDRATSDRFGESIAFTANGAVLAVGALFKDYTADLYDTGQVYTYLMSYHLGTDWQLATDPGFVNIIDSVTASIDDKLSWQVTDLVEGTDYYVRCRHLGSTYGYSDWSPIHKFTTKDMYIPSTEIGILTASDRAADDLFGSSVCINEANNLLVIGAYGRDVSGVSNAGKIYTFTRIEGEWIEESTLTASDKATNDYFGRAVSMSADGSRLAVGANGKLISGLSQCGKVYIYTRSGSTWIEESTITAHDKAINDYFGSSVALSADATRLAVGAVNKTVSGVTSAGQVYIYTRSGSVWTLESTLTASNKYAGDQYGISVSLTADGSRLLIGAYGKEYNTNTDAGITYFYTRSGSAWTEEWQLYDNEEHGTSFYFGFSSAQSYNGDILCIGSLSKTEGGVTSAGSVNMYLRTGSNIGKQFSLSASDKATNDGFSHSCCLASDGSLLFVGAPGRDSGGVADSGAVYIFK